MIRIDQVEAVQSIWDRLSEIQEQPSSFIISLRLLKESIRRDLEELLNTRQSPAHQLQEFPLARRSVFNYGLDDLSSLAPTSSMSVAAVQHAVHRCVAEYEPRLKDVKVVVASEPLAKREILLQVEAILVIQPTIEHIVFDTMLDLSSGMYSVR